jgi:hypothetical protein
LLKLGESLINGGMEVICGMADIINNIPLLGNTVVLGDGSSGSF